MNMKEKEEWREGVTERVLDGIKEKKIHLFTLLGVDERDLIPVKHGYRKNGKKGCYQQWVLKKSLACVRKRMDTQNLILLSNEEHKKIHKIKGRRALNSHGW